MGVGNFFNPQTTKYVFFFDPLHNSIFKTGPRQANGPPKATAGMQYKPRYQAEAQTAS
ncbi:hypothetical protein OLMES_0906 [Oleiphilus messinensis]|uniref:Uncharacterized protein n=1 Tax=Oleiphilus messinensis TaxID=141451 RepID=A0A1Y0I6G4_9GAMM|nr:hypothetical protein OLMES_0906 [Oleiphilus messinensis]